MAEERLTLGVHVPWWVRPYVWACSMLIAFGVPLDDEVIERRALRAIRFYSK